MLIHVNIILLALKLTLGSSELSASESESANSESNEVINDKSSLRKINLKKTQILAGEEIEEDVETQQTVTVRSTSEMPTASSDEELATDVPTTLTDEEEEHEEDEDDGVSTTLVTKQTTKSSRKTHQVSSRVTEPETATIIYPKPNSPPNPEDCKELYAAQSASEKGYAQMSRPFAVSIHKKGSFYATGALLDHSWILSSAGEFYNVRESTRLFKARLGSFDCKRGGTLAPIKSIFIHPQYVQGLPSFDVALLKIATPVMYSCTIMPTPLINTRAGVVKARFMVTYWPKLIVKGHPLPLNARERFKHQHMRVTLQNLMPWDECFQRLKAVGVKLSESSLCLRPIHSHHSPCMPDSGAPVLAPDKLWGVTSGWVSQNCSRSQSPTVITRASSPDVRVWLDSHVALRWDKE